jgi:hypothetical protein
MIRRDSRRATGAYGDVHATGPSLCTLAGMSRRLLEATLTGGDQPLEEGESFQMLVIGLGAAAIGFVVGRLFHASGA